MFTKALILVLLGTTLTLASPIDNPIAAIRGLKEDLSSWWQGIKDAVQIHLEQLKKTFEQAIDDIKGKGQKAVEISKDKLDELRQKYNELRDQAKTAIDSQTQKWQKVLEDAVKVSKQKYEEAKQQAQQALQNVKNEWQTKYDDWKNKAQEAINNAKNKQQ